MTGLCWVRVGRRVRFTYITGGRCFSSDFIIAIRDADCARAAVNSRPGFSPPFDGDGDGNGYGNGNGNGASLATVRSALHATLLGRVCADAARAVAWKTEEGQWAGWAGWAAEHKAVEDAVHSEFLLDKVTARPYAITITSPTNSPDRP